MKTSAGSMKNSKFELTWRENGYGRWVLVCDCYCCCQLSRKRQLLLLLQLQLDSDGNAAVGQ